MKKLFLVVAAVAIGLSGCGKINDALDDLDIRVTELESATIPTINEQIAAINTSIADLEAVDKELKGYITALQETDSDLKKSIVAINARIDEVTKSLKEQIADTEAGVLGELATAKADVLAQLEALKTEINAEIATINTTIATLQTKDSELEGKIAELKSYVDTELKNTKDWASATFTTLEQYNALCADIAIIKTQIESLNSSIANLESRLNDKIATDIATAVAGLQGDIATKATEITEAYTAAIKGAKDEITTAYTSSIQSAISTLETSIKQWVNEQLANYYTIAEVDAKITVLQQSTTASDNALQEELNKLKKQLETTATEITSAYKKAIEEAINTNNGVINTKIATEIATVNSRIDSELATINTKITALESRLDNIEDKVKNLLARIQSVSYIPRFNDGKATVEYYSKTSQVFFDFEISPKDAVTEISKVWQDALIMEAVYTETRAVSLVKMPIETFEADTAKGIITIMCSGINLSENFFSNTQTASARLAISDGNNSISSEYIPMVAKSVTAEQLGAIPDNQIWYTTSTGSVAEFRDSYSYEDEHGNWIEEPCFGDAKIVSNTYTDGKGVVTFDKSVTKVNYGNFQGLFVSVRLPDTVTEIGRDAFYWAYNKITHITLGNGLKSIGNRAFSCCSFSKITLPESLEYIGDYAFGSCSNLTEITIPNNVEHIGEGVFSGCNSLRILKGKHVVAGSSLICNDKLLYIIHDENLTHYEIPEGVTIIGEDTFWGCSSLTKVTIPNSVTSIGKSAFFDCKGLTSVTIPNSVTSIGKSAFSGCTGLTSVTIPNSVTSIGESAFYGCTGELIVNCNIPSSDYDYSGPFHSSDFSKVTIGNGVKTIGEYAFYECNKLTSVTIPNSVTSIGNYAFSGCDGLTRVFCKRTTPPTANFEGYGSWSAFYRNAADRKIYVPTESVDAYKVARGWKEHADAIRPYDF